MTDIASLGVEIDTSGFDQGTAAADRFNAAGERVASTTDTVSQAQQRSMQAALSAQQAWMKETSAVVQHQQALSAASDSVNKILNRYDPLSAKLRQLQSDFKALNDAASNGLIPEGQDGAVDKAYKLIQDDIKTTTALMGKAGDTSKSVWQMMKEGGLAAGLSTAYARRELVVLADEAMRGNFSRMPASLLSLTGHMGEFGFAILPVIASILALAAGVGVLIAGFVKGEQEAKGMQTALDMTHNFAGLTRGGMIDLANTISETGKITVGTAKDIVTGLVASGQIGSAAIGGVAKLTADWAQATHQDVEKLLPEMVKMFSDPAKAAQELNNQYHFLTTAEMEHIKQMQAIGDRTGAQVLLMEKMNKLIPEQAKELGTLESAWDKVAKTFSRGWDRIKGIGRPETTQDLIASNQGQIDEAMRAQSVFNSQGSQGDRAAYAQYQARIDQLKKVKEALMDKYKAEQQNTAAQTDATESLAKQQKAQEEVNKALSYHITELQNAKKLASDAPDSADKTERIRELNKEILDTQRAMTAEGRAATMAEIDGREKMRELNIKIAEEENENLYKTGQVGQATYIARKAALEDERLVSQETATQDQMNMSFLTAGEKARLAMRMQELQLTQQLNSLQAKDAIGQIDYDMQQKEYAAEEKAFDNLIKKRNEAEKSVQDYIQGLKDELAVSGKGDVERQVAIELHKMEKNGWDMDSDAVKNYGVQIRTLLQQKQDFDNYKAVINGLGDVVGGFFSHLMDGGKSAFDYLKQQLKSFAAEVIAFFAKRYVLQAIVSATGGTAGGAAGGSGASGMIGSAAGSALQSMGTSAVGSMVAGEGVGLSGAFGTGVLTGAGDFVGTGLAGLAGNAALAAGATDAFAASVAAAVPVIGWIIAIAALIYSIWGQKAGGPKAGGSAAVTVMPGVAAATSGGSLPGYDSDNHRFYTPNQADSALGQVLNQTNASYQGTLGALGGKQTGNIVFGLGYDSDKNGTSPNRVSSGVTLNGQQLYGARNVTAGKDDTDLQNQLQLETSRMLLAALQASDLPPTLAKVLNSVAASTASQQQINDIIATAKAFKLVMDVASGDPLKDGVTSFKNSMNAISTSLKVNSVTFKQLMATYDGTTASTQNLSAAAAQYYQAQTQLLAQIESIKNGISSMFGDTHRSIAMAGMDKQGQYNFLQKESDSDYAAALKSNSPEEIQRLANQINGDINSAFGMLSPEEQQAQSATFLAKLDAVNAALQERLSKLQKDAADETQTNLKDLWGKFKDVADKMGDAADTNGNAADTMNGAANTIAGAADDLSGVSQRAPASKSARRNIVNDGG